MLKIASILKRATLMYVFISATMVVVLIWLATVALRQPHPSKKTSHTPSSDMPQHSKNSSEPAENEPKILTSPESGIKMVYVHKGEYVRGSNQSITDEGPAHKVQITRDFYMSETEVTFGQWRKIMPRGYGETDEHPVTEVAWLNCVQYCNELSKKENLIPYYVIKDTRVQTPDRNGQGYRLPTEAEWEYVCRAGAITTYPFGQSSSQLEDYAWYGEGFDCKTHPVRKKKPNVWGFYDMLGNVWEWCEDSYDEMSYSQYADNKIAVDPVGASISDGRVARGGSSGYAAFATRPAARNGLASLMPFPGGGFRIVRTSP